MYKWNHWKWNIFIKNFILIKCIIQKISFPYLNSLADVTVSYVDRFDVLLIISGNIFEKSSNKRILLSHKPIKCWTMLKRNKVKNIENTSASTYEAD